MTAAVTMPRRIQRKRTAGSRLPEGVKYAGRPGIYGNPWGISRDSLWAHVGRPWRVSCGDFHHEPTFHATKRDAAQAAVDAFAGWVALDTLDPDRWINSLIVQHTYLKAALDRCELAGVDLACWCPLTDAAGRPWPCHVDVLLPLFNAPGGVPVTTNPADFPPPVNIGAAYPSLLCVFCDKCDATFEGDFLVAEDWTKPERLECVRTHVREKLGWVCDDRGDFCPNCRESVPVECDGSFTCPATEHVDGCFVWPAELLNARVQIWFCLVREHGDRRDENGGIVGTVEWRGGLAYCTAPGCDRSSAASSNGAGGAA